VQGGKDELYRRSQGMHSAPPEPEMNFWEFNFSKLYGVRGEQEVKFVRNVYWEGEQVVNLEG